MPTSTKTKTTADATTITPSFEFFEGIVSERASKPRITVRRGGLVVITRAAAELLGDAVELVQLAFDRATGAVGIRAAAKGAPGAYRLRAQYKGPNWTVGGRRFFDHYGIDTGKATTFDVTDFGDGIIGFVTTAEGASTTASPKASAKTTGKTTAKTSRRTSGSSSTKGRRTRARTSKAAA